MPSLIALDKEEQEYRFEVRVYATAELALSWVKGKDPEDACAQAVQYAINHPGKASFTDLNAAPSAGEKTEIKTGVLKLPNGETIEITKGGGRPKAALAKWCGKGPDKPFLSPQWDGITPKLIKNPAYSGDQSVYGGDSQADSAEPDQPA